MTRRSAPAALIALLLSAAQLLSLCPRAAASGTETIGGPDSGLINILLIGTDDCQDSAARADSIILCTFHPETSHITMTSFLRDLYVPIPGHRDNRINAAYALGGASLLKETMESVFSLHIDGCIEADFSQFSGIIDALGGVTVTLRQDEAEAINSRVPGDLTEGLRSLTGQQALAYSRIRNLDGDGDFSRTQRQRNLLTSLLDSYKNADLLTLLSLITKVLPLLSTDLSRRQVFSLAGKLFPFLSGPVISSQSLPAPGTYTAERRRNMEVLVADPEELRSTLRKSLGAQTENTARN